MTKTFYNKTTGGGAVFADDANIADWPDFQETQPDMAPIMEPQVRAQRDALLAESDAMALADRITADWTTYRQALRDVPSQSGFPLSVLWPQAPS